VTKFSLTEEAFSVLMMPFMCLGCRDDMTDQLHLHFRFRQMKVTQISNVRKHGKDSGLMTRENCHGWKQRWLQLHWAQCNYTFLHGVRRFQNMWRIGNLRRQCSFSDNCNEKEWVLTNSLLFKVIKAYASLGALKDGRLVHAQLIQTGCESNIFVNNSLVDMYAKCGSIEDAWRVSTRCHLNMWSLGLPWYWDMWNAAKGRRHWNYFGKRNRKVCSQTLLLFGGCWIHVLV